MTHLCQDKRELRRGTSFQSEQRHNCLSDGKSRETEGREWSGETSSQRVLPSTVWGVNGEGRSTGVRLSMCDSVFGGKTETGMIKPVWCGIPTGKNTLWWEPKVAYRQLIRYFDFMLAPKAYLHPSSVIVKSKNINDTYGTVTRVKHALIRRIVGKTENCFNHLQTQVKAVCH